MFKLIVLSHVLLSILPSFEAKDVVVNTSLGPIRGKVEIKNNAEIAAFLGVPFGKPPVGNRRFARPEPIDPWNDTLNTTKYKPDCLPQIPFFPHETSEDCLYLNVWMPTAKSSRRRPVIVYIYPSGFITGTAQTEGSLFSSLTDTVVVSMNYRLNVFGFLNLHINEAPGNMGLLDQQLAMEWVKNNIESFGGDRNSVTIIGFSAGGASVGYHLLSPKSHDLFKFATMHSGTPIAPWAFDDRDSILNKAKQLAVLVNCRKSDVYLNPRRLAKCLKEMSPKLLIDALPKLKLPLPQTFSFVPTVDNHFITDTPHNLLSQGKFKKTNVIIGADKTDGGALMKLFFFSKYFHKEFPTIEQLKGIPKQMYPDASDDLLNEIKSKYFGEKGPSSQKNGTIAMSVLISDTGFICPSTKFADFITKFGGKAFYYSFRHRQIGSTSWDEVPHISDLPYFFGTVQESGDFTETEKELSKRMITQWMNFAKTGDPTLNGFTWPVYGENNRNYYSMNIGAPEVGVGPRTSYCKFWKDFEDSKGPSSEK